MEKNKSIYPVPTTDTNFRVLVIDMLLGKDWYVTDSMNQEQVNTIAIDAIQRKYCDKSILDKFFGSKRIASTEYWFLGLCFFFLVINLLCAICSEDIVTRSIYSILCTIWSVMFGAAFYYLRKVHDYDDI